jgi:Protein of unknown function (DUF3717)
MIQPPPVPESRHVSITQIEAAINVWRNRHPAVSDDEVLVLCTEARSLANLYGHMIFTRAERVEVTALSETQLAALHAAIG